MDKRYLHHVWAKLRPLSHWYLLAACLSLGVVFILSYRQNNIRMIELRDKVFAADETNGDIETALRDLRSYVYGHMNARLVNSSTAIKPPIQLKYTYERLTAQEKARVDAKNAQIRTEAESICKAKFPTTHNATGIQPCIEGYMLEKGATEQPIPKELYQFDFISPAWSPDVAGWSLVLTVIFGILFIVRFGMERWLRHQLEDHA
jgi:hypothetical protein